MALTYEKPNAIAFSRSPILYSAFESTFTDTDFYYTADVYVWQGLIGDKPTASNYSLEKYPTPNGTVVFNVQSLVNDYFINPKYTFSSYIDTTEMYVWVAVTLNWVDTEGTGTPVVLDPTVCYNGYNSYLEGLNYLTGTSLGNAPTSTFIERVSTDGGIIEAPDCISDELLTTTGNGFFMTDRCLTMDIPPDTSMHLYMISDDASLVAGWRIRVNDGEDTISGSSTTGVTVELISVPCGSTEVAAISKVVPTKWEVYGIDNNDNIITKVYTFNLVDPCKWGFKNLQFLNRYGVWDNLLVYGSKIDKLDVTRDEIFNTPLTTTTAPLMSMTTEYGQFHMNNVHARKTIKVNTGWVDECSNNLMEQFMLTEHIFDPDTSQPYTLETKSLTIKTALNDGLINYTFDLKYANTAINTVY